MGRPLIVRHGPERRAFGRKQPAGGSELRTARVRAGREVTIVNVSGSGVLVEGRMRMLPGIQIELQVMDARSLRRLTGRVVRCHVAHICPVRGVLYRAGVMFDQVVGGLEGLD
jgi:hypothetical protein